MIKLPLKAESTNGGPDITVANLTLREDAYRLAREIFKSEEMAGKFANHLLDVCTKAEGKDFLIVHNPGGWGHARLDQCLEWERGIVAGVKAVMEEMGLQFLADPVFPQWRRMAGRDAGLERAVPLFFF